MRSEWYGYHFPELIKAVSDNLLYAKTVKLIRSRANLNAEMLPALEELLMDSSKAQMVWYLCVCVYEFGFVL